MATRLRSPDARSVVALLATRGRFDLLALRAFPSILAQSRLPDRILVVVDQPPSELPDDGAPQLARLARGTRASTNYTATSASPTSYSSRCSTTTTHGSRTTSNAASVRHSVPT